MDFLALTQLAKKISHLLVTGGIVMLFSPALVFAAPPGSPYAPGETLDPACAPGSANCTVTSIQSVANGGTGWASVASGALLYGDGSSTLATTSVGATGNILAYESGVPTWIATSTLGVDVSDTLGVLTVARGGTGATSFTQGWLYSSGDGNALSASTSPTVNYITATSTTATSTFANGIAINGGGLTFGNLTSCSNLGTDNVGNVGCQLGQYAIDVRKSADESLTDNAVLQDDDELFFPIGANETWVFQFNLLYTTLATPDIQLAVTAPSGATCDYAGGSVEIADGAGSAICGGAVAIVGGSATDNDPLYVYGAIENGSTAGTVQLQWAQNTSNSNATSIHRGSSLSAFRINGGADIGEVYYSKDVSLVSGTVVALDPSLHSGVRRTTGKGEAIGVVSTKPGIIIGDTIGAHDGAPVIVALAGRVPVRVVTENGAIKAGDYLTPSSVPGVAMRIEDIGPVIGQAMSAYEGDGVGMVVAFVKNFDVGQSPLLFGNTLSSSTDIHAIQSESAHNPVAILAKKITDGAQSVVDFVAARVTAIRGYFEEVFAKKVHTEQLCVKKSDGNEVCVNGDQIHMLLESARVAPAADIPIEDSPVAFDEPISASTSPTISDEAVDISTTTIEVQSITTELVPTETPPDIPQTTPDPPSDEAEVTVPVEMQTIPPSDTASEPTL
ncbi:MAG: hypothetical protein NUV59_02210 [Patescibacteria group bacterium]|nr:hypothetical protein [Patescibacteria group bacterium]